MYRSALKMIYFIIASLGGLMAFSANAYAVIIVGSKLDIESIIIGTIMSQALSAADIPVQEKLQTGPTIETRNALLAGQIDLYAEYTGNGSIFFKSDDGSLWSDPRSAYETVARLDKVRNSLIWLRPAPATNEWAIAVRQDLISRMHGATFEDFAEFVRSGGAVKIAASAEFVQSPAALPEFEKAYGFVLKDDQIVQVEGGSSAAVKKVADPVDGINCAMIYTNDSVDKALGLVRLIDNKRVQYVFQPAPVIRQSALDENHGVQDLLNRVFTGLTYERLRSMNHDVVVEGRSVSDVARAYLEDIKTRR